MIGKALGRATDWLLVIVRARGQICGIFSHLCPALKVEPNSLEYAPGTNHIFTSTRRQRKGASRVNNRVLIYLPILAAIPLYYIVNCKET